MIPRILTFLLWNSSVFAVQPILEPIDLENIHHFPIDRSLEFIVLRAYADLNQNKLVIKNFETRARTLLMSSVEKISLTKLNHIIKLWKSNQDFPSDRQLFLSLHLLNKFNDVILVALETLNEQILTYTELTYMIRIIEKSKLIISAQLEQFEPSAQTHLFSNFFLTFKSLKYALCDYIRSFTTFYQPEYIYIDD